VPRIVVSDDILGGVLSGLPEVLAATGAVATAASVMVKAKIDKAAEVRKAEIEAETKRQEIAAETERVRIRESAETRRERIRLQGAQQRAVESPEGPPVD
jgi:hypothetical protein